MEAKPLSGKAIYQPAGKAGEYAKYACSFYVGCSKKGRFKAAIGGDTPMLKKCFKEDEHALEIFEKELLANLPELQKHGLFFTFTSDPFLKEATNLTLRAMQLCCMANVNIKVLTKRTDFVYNVGEINGKKVSFAQLFCLFKSNIAVGFTLTGHDELEPNASTNAERIEAMKKLHDAGFKTFASIEPVIDFDSAENMIFYTHKFCDLYKIGLMSGYSKPYLEHGNGVPMRISVNSFVKYMCKQLQRHAPTSKIYFKDSLLKAAGISRSELPDCCVARDYNIFKSK